MRLLVNTGVGLGAVVPIPGVLVHPLRVCVTVYCPPVVTVMEGVVAPLLQSSVPVNPDAVNSLLPQLLVTFTTGAGTTVLLGSAVPVPGVLVQPLTVCVTVYCPADATVIDGVVAPVLHNNEPVKPDAVSTELPQLFTTDTFDGAGIGFGDAVPLAAPLVHPFTF